MTAVIGFGELALLRLNEGDPVRDYVDEAKRAGERATELTQRLLAFGRRQTLRPRPLDLNVVVGEMRTLLGRLIGPQIELRFELAEVPCPLVADRSPARAGRDEPRDQRARRDGARRAADDRDGVARPSTVRLTVSDTGSGMDAETRAQIFEPFFTTKEEGKGTGLGLSTVFGIVHQSGGRIAVNSELRRGTTFTIDLPRGAVAPPEGDDGGADAVPRGGSESILVVEDDEAIRALVRGVLEASGYDVRVAAEAEEALGGPGRRPARDRHPDAGDERARSRRPDPGARAGHARDLHLGLHRRSGRTGRERPVPGQAVHAERVAQAGPGAARGVTRE